jgi:hypothetical protein
MTVCDFTFEGLSTLGKVDPHLGAAGCQGLSCKDLRKENTIVMILLSVAHPYLVLT